ncbi:MAG: MBOAT family protein [Ardenticatenaceae bacterium]|nr:MBOAT family protein [Ardenticatenaceae bacterium]
MTFNLTTILILITAAVLYNLLPPRGREWFLFSGSIIAVYGLQPFLPIRFSGFILPTVTLLLVTAVWHITQAPAYKFTREDKLTVGLMAALVITLSLFRYIPPSLNPFANRPPNPLFIVAFVGVILLLWRLKPQQRLRSRPAPTKDQPAQAGFVVVAANSDSRRILFAQNAAILLIVLLFIALKSEPMAVGIGRFWRTLTAQDPTIASHLDLTWLGFSYIAFRLIHTLRDAQTGLLPTLSLREFTSYVLFFPALIAGPIDRAERFIQDFRALPTFTRFDAARFYQAFTRITLGLLKKFIIADSLAQGLALTPLSAEQATSTPGLWLLLYGYALRLYFDFSGYTDIAIGIGLLFGIELPENFRRPYFQTSLTAFWQSWHITLSSWVRFYVFSPLSRHLLRRKPRPSPILIVLISQSITMIVIGLWHGLSLNFFIWGLWHGLGLFVHKQWSDKTRHWYRHIQNTTWPRRLWTVTAWFLTFHYVVLGWVWFLLPDFTLALQTFAKLFAL